MKKQIIMTNNKIFLSLISLLYARDSSAAVVTFATPTPKIGTLYDFVVTILQIVIKIGIPVIAVLFIWTGYLFVSAQGDTAQLKTAKNAFFTSVIGTIILLCAVLIATMIKATIGELGA